jgi:HPt (histidine-containing phosphotransfer) domain-containing protein
MSAALPYDYADSLQRMGNDEELFQEMVGFLRADSPRWLRTLQAAMRDCDYAVVERSAHCLKGLASNFAAARAVAAAGTVERLAGQVQVSLLPTAILELEEAFAELIAALEPQPQPPGDARLADLVSSAVASSAPLPAGAASPP